MKCPIDQNDLVMSERQGVEIDYCPQCRGVWLDRGELDKIIDRVAAEQPTAPPSPGVAPPGPAPAYPTPARPTPGYPPRHAYGSPPSPPSPDDYHRRGGQTGYDQYGRPYRLKRGGLLGELFDF